ncbi:hypothetical protein E4U55_006088 [Claviceps digitariae]|nr:hypothetical protein E4U55_006088 [Claviceps digitariae]
MASITILYPSGHDFDLKYYLETHMPLAESWDITHLAPGQTFQIQAVLKFTSLAAWEQASLPETAGPVFGDLPAFTTAKPLVLKGEAKAFGNVA